MERTTIRCALARASLTALALLALAGTGRAQEDLKVEVVCVRGVGQLVEGDEPEVAPALARWASALKDLGAARYELLQEVSQTLRPDQPLTLEFPDLTPPHRAEVRVEPDQPGWYRVQVLITRAGPREDQRVQVLTTEVRVREGKPFAVRCERVFPDGDLLLLVSARSGPPR